MKHWGRAAVLAIGVAASCHAGAQMACKQLTSAQSEPGEWTFTGNELAMLLEVHERLSRAAERAPLLFLCESRMVNAMAKPDDGDGVILVTTGVLRLAHGEIDEVAAVIAHEFGHLIDEHGRKKREAALRAARQASREYTKELRSGTRAAAARENAMQAFIENITAFSRAAEREADDEGFSLAQRAGFAPSGARRFSEKMLKLKGDVPNTYLSTHPGWGERTAYNRQLDANEKHRLVAQQAADAGDSVALGRALREWKAEVPDSGAAAYYEGVYMLMTHAPSDDVARKFDQAVSYFAGEGLSRASQSHQAELDSAQLALCVSLYREGRKHEALACVQGLRTKGDVARFKDLTGWGELIWLPRAGGGQGSLYSGRGEDGTVVISNCNYVADREGLTPIRAWRPARTVDAARQHGGYTAMQCAPNSCDCEPIPESSVPSAAVEVVK